MKSNKIYTNNKMQVHLNIVGLIGERLYSGKITWLREYIQNAIDSGATEITISIEGRDLKILDNGCGIDKNSLKEKILSIGYSEKTEGQIGELGIGIYAGVWICDKVIIYTKQIDTPCYKAEFDSKKYNEILKEEPLILFEEGISKIYSSPIEDSYSLNYSSFTNICFENVSNEVLKLLGEEEIKIFIKDNINVPISEDFPFKQEVESFLKNNFNPITIELKYNGIAGKIEKFDNLNVLLYEPIFHEIKDEDDKIISKIWACYNKGGEAFEDSSIFIKFKGMTIGDKTTISSKIYGKFSAKSRFIGEIVILNPDLKVNTGRDWFIDSKELDKTVKKIKKKITKLHHIAEEDSRYGIGIKNNIDRCDEFTKKIRIAKDNKNEGLVKELESKKYKIDNTIKQKEENLANKKGVLEKNETNLGQEDALILRIFRSTQESSHDKSINIPSIKEDSQKKRKSPIPEILKTLITKKIIDPIFEKPVLGKNLKDTTSNVFTIVETTVKEKLGCKNNSNQNFSELIEDFFKKFEPAPNNKKRYNNKPQLYADLKFFLLFTHRFFRNYTVHSILTDEEDTDSNIIRVLIIGDFALQIINSMEEKMK